MKLYPNESVDRLDERQVAPELQELAQVVLADVFTVEVQLLQIRERRAVRSNLMWKYWTRQLVEVAIQLREAYGFYV